MSDTKDNLITELNLAVARLKEQLDNVVRTTLSWEGGCMEGKLEFLDRCGLEAPKSKKRATFDIDAVWPLFDLNGDEYNDANELIDAALDAYCDEHDLSVSWRLAK